MTPIRILIVDDHTVVRQGIRMIVNTEATIQVVGEASDGQIAIRQVEQLQPDVILMDLVMPHESGLEAMTHIKHNYPKIKIVVLTTFEDEGKIKAAMEAGADGFLLKDADGEALLQAIHSAYQGEMPLHPRIARYLFKSIGKDFTENNFETLTEREVEVLQLVAQGLSNKEVAHALSLSEGTIKIHVSNILGKLNVSSRTGAAMRAAQIGLLSTDEDDNEAASYLA